MIARANPGNRETLNLETESTTEDGQGSLEDYQAVLTANAQATGQDTARRSDPAGFDLILEAIREAAASGSVFTADDCAISGRDNAVGAGFRHLARRGEIHAVGWDVSRRQASHGRALRSWRRSP